MFTKKQIDCAVLHFLLGLVLGAVFVHWLLPLFGLAGLSAWVGGIAGAIVAVLRTFARDTTRRRRKRTPAPKKV